mgnify:CR=1
MDHGKWKEQAACKGYDVELFFDKYEEEQALRPAMDALCQSCPVMRDCFANGVSLKEYGVWGGVFLENGKVSREFGRHRTKADWATVWKSLTTDG